MGLEVLEHGAGEPAQLRHERLAPSLRERRLELAGKLLPAPLHQLGEERGAVLEVVVDGAHGDAGAGGDLLHARVAHALGGEDLLGGVGDGARRLAAEPLPEAGFMM